MNFHLERLQNDIASAIAGFSSEDYAWHPEGKWSTAEILEHLYLTYTGTSKGFERCIAGGVPLARPRTLKDRAGCFLVLTCKYLPEGRTAPKQTAPRGLPAEQVREELFARLAEMDATIAQAAEKFGGSILLLDHPILGPLSADDWCLFHRIHGHHHVKQIVRRRDALKTQRSRSIS
jgi:DinB superfamily